MTDYSFPLWRTEAWKEWFAPMTEMPEPTPARLCDAFIEVEGDFWAGTYCKLLAGHNGPCSPHYPAEVALTETPEPKPDQRELCRGCGAVFGACHRADCPYGRPWPRDRVDNVQTRVEPVRGIVGNRYVAWFTTYPRTHEKAGQTVEVVTREQYDRLDRALRKEQDKADDAVGDLRALIEEQAAEITRLRDLLRELAVSPPVFDDERVGYVEVQIVRPLWRELLRFRFKVVLDEGER